MALLADFGSPGDAVGDVRLGMRDLQVLLHEWGHCCHNLLSTTKYQHLWGTRCAQDVVELPSHLWEYFALDPRTLAYLVRHYATLDPLPAEAYLALAAGRRQFAALELQQQASVCAAPRLGASMMHPKHAALGTYMRICMHPKLASCCCIPTRGMIWCHVMSGVAFAFPKKQHVMNPVHHTTSSLQVLLSLADQQLFSSQAASSGRTSDAWRAAVEPYSCVPWVEGEHEPGCHAGHTAHVLRVIRPKRFWLKARVIHFSLR
jgi:hypothetical protein